MRSLRSLPRLVVLSLLGLAFAGFELESEARAGKITGGERQSCAVTSGGAVTCWGQRSTGSLGDGQTSGISFDPAVVTGLKAGATAVAGTSTGNGGSMYGCAIVAGGVKCWGTNGYGTLGNGATQSSAVPVAATGLETGVTDISLNATHACAVQAGAVKCWGSGYLGSTTKKSPVALAVPGLTAGATGVAVGWRHACALVSGAVSCWGKNTSGQLGSAGSTATTPRPVTGLTGPVTQIAAGVDFTCALVGGGVSCFGSKSKIGNGTNVASTVPVAVKGLESGVTEIAANWDHACAVKAGAAWCWGGNNNGQLGNGTKLGGGGGGVASLVPVAVSGPTGITSIGVGRSHSCAIAAGGTVWCWGSNSGGQLGSEPAGSQTSVAVKVTGALVPSIVAAKSPQRLNAKSTVMVATVKCPVGTTCKVTGPKTIRVSVGGEQQVLTVKVPSVIGSGRTAEVTVTATAAGAAVLKGKAGSVKVTLQVERYGRVTPLSASVKVSG